MHQQPGQTAASSQQPAASSQQPDEAKHHAEGRKQGDYPSSSLAATQLVDVARAMNIESVVIDGSDMRGVTATVSDLVARARKGEGPFFVESRLWRSWSSSDRRVDGIEVVAQLFRPKLDRCTSSLEVIAHPFKASANA